MSDAEKLKAWRTALAAHVDRLAEKHVRERLAAREAPRAGLTDAALDAKPEQHPPRTPPESVSGPEDHRRLSG